MKVSKEVRDYIKSLIDVHSDYITIAREQYKSGNFSRADRCKDVNKRFRWDIFYALNRKYLFMHKYFPKYSNDHIDTMLRGFPELKLK